MAKTRDSAEVINSEDQKSFRSALKNKAIGLLARREYSAKELRAKLVAFSDSESLDEAISSQSQGIIDEVIHELQELGYQSDLRFASMFVRHKAQSGNGPLKISRELSFKGGDRSVFEQVIEEEHIDFFENAKELMERKFSVEQLTDYQAFQKVFRYFANRGFTSDQIKYAKETLLSERS